MASGSGSWRITLIRLWLFKRPEDLPRAVDDWTTPPFYSAKDVLVHQVAAQIVRRLIRDLQLFRKPWCGQVRRLERQQALRSADRVVRLNLNGCEEQTQPSLPITLSAYRPDRIIVLQ